MSKKQNCYNDPTTWNRHNIQKVLKKNPALKEALSVLGVSPEELADKVREREKIRQAAKDEASYLNALVNPDLKVGAAIRPWRDILAGGKAAEPTALVSATRAKPETLESLKKKVVGDIDKNVVVVKTKDESGYSKAMTQIHVGYHLNDADLLSHGPHARCGADGTVQLRKVVELPQGTQVLKNGEDLPVGGREAGQLAVPMAEAEGEQESSSAPYTEKAAKRAESRRARKAKK